MKLSKEPFSLSNLYGYNVIEKNVKHWYQYQLNNNTIAFAAIGTNPYHPYCDEVSINVHPDYQRQGIATQLLKQIEVDSTQSLKVSINSNNEYATAWLENKGFVCRRKTYEYSILTNKFPKLSFHESSVIPFNQADEAILDKIKVHFFNYYIQTHQYISPLNKDFDSKTFFNISCHSMDSANSYIYILDNTLSYLIVEIDSSTDEAFISYLGSNAPTNLKRNFYSQVISDLAHTYSALSFEIHNTDPEAILLIELLQLEEIPSYDAYIK